MARPNGTKMIQTPEKMWDLFVAYQKWAKETPYRVKDWVGKDGDQIEREKERPLTMEGFECYVFGQGLNGELSYYFANRDNKYADYLPVCSRIRKAIRADQIEGGMAGMYNPSITQRLNGLVEKVQEDGSKELTIKVKYERKGNNIGGAASGAAEGTE